MTEPTPLPATSVALLADWATRTPYAPWLFYRRGWDWQWRSWRRVADQVARGAERLRGWASDGAAAGPAPHIAFEGRQDPDTVAVGLAIEAIDAVGVPFPGREREFVEQAAQEGCVAWAGVEGAMPAEPVPETLERIALPPALSALERTPRQSLHVEHEPAVGSATVSLIADARQLDHRVPLSARRDIVCAAPSLTPGAMRQLQAWTLVRGAAWVLEPYADAFVPTVLWARPTIACGSAVDLAPLAGELEDRKHRRHSRLATILAVGAAPIGPTLWADLEVEIVELGENR